jgi:hypothetical protein
LSSIWLQNIYFFHLENGSADSVELIKICVCTFLSIFSTRIQVTMQLYKTLFLNMLSICKIYKGRRKRKRENLQDVKLAQTRCQNCKTLFLNILSICKMYKGRRRKRKRGEFTRC